MDRYQLEIVYVILQEAEEEDIDELEVMQQYAPAPFPPLCASPSIHISRDTETRKRAKHREIYGATVDDIYGTSDIDSELVGLANRRHRKVLDCFPPPPPPIVLYSSESISLMRSTGARKKRRSIGDSEDAWRCSHAVCHG
jgi:hypothetical protein